MKVLNKKRKFRRKGFTNDAPRKKKKINDDFSNVSLKKGKLITVMISNFPKNQTQYSLDSYLKSNGILCWGCRANFPAQVAFIDVEAKDCEKVLALHEQEWDGNDLLVKLDETTNVRKKKTKSEKVTKFETVERHRRTLCCKNVPYEVFSQKIEALFRGVKEVYIVRDKRTGKPTGICFVEFFTEEEMEDAFEKKETVRIDGRKLNIFRCEEDTYQKQQDSELLQKYIPKSSSGSDDFEPVKEEKQSFFDRNKKKKGAMTVVLSNFPNDQNQSSLFKFLRRSGISVIECRANFETQVAFVDVEEKDFRKALKLNSKIWNGHKLVVEEERKPVKQPPQLQLKAALSSPKTDSNSCGQRFTNDDTSSDRTLCCKNLPFGISTQQIKTKFHDVKDVRNLHDENGQPTGMAYIEFITKESLEIAYAKKDSIEMNGRKLQLTKMGPLVRKPTPSLSSKSTISESQKSPENKSKSPADKRKKKTSRSKKGVVSSNKYMRR